MQMQITSGATNAGATSPGARGVACAQPGAVTIQGDFPSDRTSMTMEVFEELLNRLQMRQLAFEPCSRTFRPHSVKALTVLQRLRRLQDSIQEGDAKCPGLGSAADRLVEIAEMSDTISWTVN